MAPRCVGCGFRRLNVRTCSGFTVQYPTFSHPKFMFLLVTVHRRFNISYSRRFLFTLSTRLYWHFVVCRDLGLMEVIGEGKRVCPTTMICGRVISGRFRCYSCVSNNNSEAVFWEQSDYSMSRTSLYNRTLALHRLEASYKGPYSGHRIRMKLMPRSSLVCCSYPKPWL